MKIKMNNTFSAAVARRLDELRDTTGAVTLGRVLTLIIVARNEDGVTDGIEAAAGASRAHPCRMVIVLPTESESPQLDAEIRVGAEVGLSEIAILRARGAAGDNLETLVSPLLLPDTPIVTWWVQDAPQCPSCATVGSISSRRITTARELGDPVKYLATLRDHYHSGDTDLSWAGVTLWRNSLAAMLDEPPYEPVTSGEVRGSLAHPSTFLLAGWLALRLGVPIDVVGGPNFGIDGVTLHRQSGDVELDRPVDSGYGDMKRPGRQTQRVNLPMRSLEAMLIEELREATQDTAYAEVLQDGLALLDIAGFKA
ncbi:glucose-6-phosphate dehydrogenase assembly protein OpcA [Changpingibacter yushuensis]|uniref:glucose-6-phosphate dehydrogenase assembly protein OpcA n=1 Tax=Changpingibacter yushuensis TaxID=2758440 RepID=UPI0015F3FF96|nr:glucose-6-phosphate dehydrogenase assembly protein OpcA [Changpingibacter yushuensis]